MTLTLETINTIKKELTLTFLEKAFIENLIKREVSKIKSRIKSNKEHKLDLDWYTEILNKDLKRYNHIINKINKSK